MTKWEEVSGEPMLGEDGFHMLVRREFAIRRIPQAALNACEFVGRRLVEARAELLLDLLRHPLKLVLSVRWPGPCAFQKIGEGLVHSLSLAQRGHLLNFVNLRTGVPCTFSAMFHSSQKQYVIS